jgi:heme oxygenase (biliverdin-producing, ferredoxin)
MDQSTTEEPLSRSLFAGSAVIHRHAERRPFQVVFLKAQLPREAYVEYLGRLSYVYAALEETDEALRNDPLAGRMYSPELHRGAAIDRDMRFFSGSDWRNRFKPSPATEAYADRIRWTGEQLPPAFVAHQWLRYLGNVLAQRVLLRIMDKAYGLTGDGVAFYKFDGIADPRAYLGSYHERMNSMPLDDATRALVVEEGNRAFSLQIDFTDELAADLGIADPGAEEAERVLGELAAEHP